VVAGAALARPLAATMGAGTYSGRVVIRRPLALERDYRARLWRRLRVAATLRREGVGRAPEALVAAYEAALPLELASFERLAVGVEGLVTREVVRVVSALTRTDVRTDQRLTRQAALLAQVRRQWAQVNVTRVRALERRVLRGELPDGRAWASVIARDEMGSLAAHITRLRCEALGVPRYRWVANEGARGEHAALHGTVRAWADEGEHPGQGRGCRCCAQPIL